MRGRRGLGWAGRRSVGRACALRVRPAGGGGPAVPQETEEEQGGAPCVLSTSAGRAQCVPPPPGSGARMRDAEPAVSPSPSRGLPPKEQVLSAGALFCSLTLPSDNDAFEACNCFQRWCIRMRVNCFSFSTCFYDCKSKNYKSGVNSMTLPHAPLISECASSRVGKSSPLHTCTSFLYS